MNPLNVTLSPNSLGEQSLEDMECERILPQNGFFREQEQYFCPLYPDEVIEEKVLQYRMVPEPRALPTGITGKKVAVAALGTLVSGAVVQAVAKEGARVVKEGVIFGGKVAAWGAFSKVAASSGFEGTGALVGGGVLLVAGFMALSAASWSFEEAMNSESSYNGAKSVVATGVLAATTATRGVGEKLLDMYNKKVSSYSFSPSKASAFVSLS